MHSLKVRCTATAVTTAQAFTRAFHPESYLLAFPHVGEPIHNCAPATGNPGLQERGWEAVGELSMGLVAQSQHQVKCLITTTRADTYINYNCLRGYL